MKLRSFFLQNNVAKAKSLLWSERWETFFSTPVEEEGAGGYDGYNPALCSAALLATRVKQSCFIVACHMN